MAARTLALLFALRAAGAAAASAPYPLFPYETKQLTDGIIAKLPPDQQKLFGFDDTAVNSNFMTRSGECKVFPGDVDWPSETTWDTFNAAIEGALIPTVPIGAPCFKSWGVHDEAKCAEIESQWTNPYLHEADPTSNMFPLYQGKTCFPRSKTNGTCTLGSYPTYAVNVSSVAQIQLALNFARNSNLRLVIKNTGHCYLGKSLGAGALSVWTHNLKDIEFIEHYKSTSGYEGSAIKVGAGVVMRELYEAAHQHNVTVTGGICESVGFAGGYFTGGGHTPMSGYYGMAADNIEEIQVVTADGRYITASNTSHSDLFWALRGGGGSTFGITTSVIVRAHPKIPVVTSTFTFEAGGNVTADVFWAGVRKFWEMFPAFADAHTYSYFWIWQLPGNITQFQMTPFWAPGHTLASFDALVAPWFAHLRDLGIPFTPKTTRYDAFYPAYHESWGNETIGTAGVLPGNRIFPRSNWEDPQKFERMFAAIKAHSLSGRLLGGYHQAPQNRLNVDNAVSSAFRHTLSFLIGGASIEGGEDGTQAQIRDAAAELTALLQRWREVAPESEFGGSYLNEANVVEPGWQESFYGIQYPRLLELKSKWDPKSVFYATTAVGSEGWEVRDGDWGTQTQNGRLCRV
ncbi:FAD-binding domain-containing protein [Pyrenochaeta sp. DS3sAY3a]|nr:FAD-binding domain-containing protein [Pyrenochaeta sp. DS3sAY3a]